MIDGRAMGWKKDHRRHAAGSPRAELRFASDDTPPPIFDEPDLARFRVNIFRQRGYLGLAMRAIPFEVPTMTA